MAVQFAQFWFCGEDLEEVESAMQDGLYDALFAGSGGVIVLSYGRIPEGITIEIGDREGSCFTRYFKRFSKVTVAPGA